MKKRNLQTHWESDHKHFFHDFSKLTPLIEYCPFYYHGERYSIRLEKIKNTSMIKTLLVILLFFTGNLLVFSQSCSVNARGNTAICGTSYTLQGSTTGTPTGTPTWTIVTKPAGAPDPVFSNPNILTPNITGMTFPGN